MNERSNESCDLTKVQKRSHRSTISVNIRINCTSQQNTVFRLILQFYCKKIVLIPNRFLWNKKSNNFYKKSCKNRTTVIDIELKDCYRWKYHYGGGKTIFIVRNFKVVSNAMNSMELQHKKRKLIKSASKICFMYCHVCWCCFSRAAPFNDVCVTCTPTKSAHPEIEISIGCVEIGMRKRRKKKWHSHWNGDFIRIRVEITKWKFKKNKLLLVVRFLHSYTRFCTAKLKFLKIFSLFFTHTPHGDH